MIRPRAELSPLPALDGLRGVAFLMVLYAHLPLPASARNHSFGGGVMVFFVLSGFLITTLLLREAQRTQRLDFRRFYIRRGFRLLPAALLVVAAVVVATTFGASTGITPGGVVASVFYFANFWDLQHHAYVLGWLEHMWSLSVEEQFYLVWPAALIVLLRRGARVPLAVCAVGVVAISCYRGIAGGHLSGVHLARDTTMVADQLLWGCGLALLVSAVPNDVIRRAGAKAGLLGAAGIVFAALVTEGSDFYRFGLPALGLGTVLVIASSVNGGGPVQRALQWAPLRRVGIWSYSLYLWHYPIILAVIELAPHAHLRRVEVDVLSVVLSFAAAIASFYLFERPIRAYGRRLADRSTVRRGEGQNSAIPIDQ